MPLNQIARDFFQSNVSLGIGTTTPVATMHIYASNVNATYNSAGLLLENGGQGEVGIGLKTAAMSTSQWTIGADASSTRLDVTYGTSTQQLAAADAKLSVTSVGQVGVGLTNPSFAIDVAGYVRSSLGFRVGNNEVIDADGNVVVRSVQLLDGSGGIALFVTNTGDVGIGTDNPTAKLQVVGTIAGDGSSLTNLNASFITSGTLSSAYLPADYSASSFCGSGCSLSNLNATLITTGTLNNDRLPSDMSATSFSGSGSSLSNLNASLIIAGTLGNVFLPAHISVSSLTGSGASLSNLNASLLTSGTLANALLPSSISVTSLAGSGANITSLNASAIHVGTLGNGFLPANVSVTSLAGSGTSLSNLNASLITGGTLANVHLPSSISVTSLFGSGASLSNLNASLIHVGTLGNGLLPANMSITSFTGSGTSLSNLNASLITSGTLANALLPSSISVTSLAGSGANITSLNASAINAGTLANALLPTNISVTSLAGSGSSLSNLNASLITEGTLANALLPTNISVTSLAGSGSSLSNLNASLVTSGTLNASLLPTSGVTATTYGSSTQIPVITVDDKGRITAATLSNLGGSSQWSGTTNITFAEGNVGIGTVTPLARTHIYHTGTGDVFRVDDEVAPDTTPFLINEVGNVGVGTTTPAAKLHVYHTGTGDILRVDDESAPDTTPFFINEDGNIGIGTNIAQFRVDVQGTTESTSFTTCAGIANSTARPAIGTSVIAGQIHSFGCASGTTLSTSADDGLLRLSAGGGTNATMRSYIDISGSSTVTERHRNIVLGTAGVERMRIDEDGNVGIGTATNLTFKMRVEGNVGVSGSITAQGEVTAFGSLSDARWKDHIAPMGTVLDTVDQLRPVTYTWRNDLFLQEKRGQGDIGLIAQEVEPLVPEVVQDMEFPGVEGSYKGIRYEKLVPLLIKAVQELRQEVHELRGRVYQK
jgi:hypothetical protein